jgi:hypothetical protein
MHEFYFYFYFYEAHEGNIIGHFGVAKTLDVLH